MVNVQTAGGPTIYTLYLFDRPGLFSYPYMALHVKQKLTGHSQFSKVFNFESQASFLTLIDLINSVFQIGSVSDNEKTTKETGNAKNPPC